MVVVTTRNKLIVEVKTDIINHLYMQTLDIWELKERGEVRKRVRRIMNVYDNYSLAD